MEVLALALARGLHLAAALSAFGALGFAVLVAPAGRAEAAARPLRRQLSLVVRTSAALAWVGAGIWLPLQAAAMAGAPDAGTAFAAIPAVVFDTGFGQALALRLGLLAAAAWLAAPHRPRGMPGFAGLLDDGQIWAVIAFLRAGAPSPGPRGPAHH